MNSLTTVFLDFQYFICFYATEIDYSGMRLEVRSLNITEGPIPWGYVDLNTGYLLGVLFTFILGNDMCISSSGIRAIGTTHAYTR